MATVIRLIVQLLGALLPRFGWLILAVAFSRYGKRLWRWFWE